MQPTDVQVQRTLAALQDAPHDEPHPAITREQIDGMLGDLPAGLLLGLETGPAVRTDRLEEARGRLETGVVPTDAELASRIVGRLVCDRLAGT